MIQLHQLYHTVVIYENYLICIFMNIKENIVNERKSLETITPGDRLTHITSLGEFLFFSVEQPNCQTKSCSKKDQYGKYKVRYFPWQPIILQP